MFESQQSCIALKIYFVKLLGRFFTLKVGLTTLILLWKAQETALPIQGAVRFKNLNSLGKMIIFCLCTYLDSQPCI